MITKSIPESTTNSRIELTLESQNVSKEKLDYYVPGEHRVKETSTPTFGSLANLIKASLGSGVLAMPLAFKNAGLVVGCIGTALVGFLCTYCLHILVRTSQEACEEARVPSLGYADTCHSAFKLGPPKLRRWAGFIRGLADFGLAATHLGGCCVYIVSIAEAFRQLCLAYGGPEWSLQIWCLMTLIILVPLTQLRTLKHLAPFSAFANLAMFTSIAISLYYCFTDIPSISERKVANSPEYLPLFFVTCLFAMEGVGVVMPVENEMARPEFFLGCPGVLNSAMSIIVVLFGTVGFFGYLKFGDDVRANIILDLPQNDILAQVAKLLVAIVLMFSYALIYYVPVDVVWRRIGSKVPMKAQNYALSGVKLAGVLLTVGLSTAVPNLELFTELVGSICLVLLGLMIPAIVDGAWTWRKSLPLTANKYINTKTCGIIKDLLIVILSVIALVTGTYNAFSHLIQGLSGGKTETTNVTLPYTT